MQSIFFMGDFKRHFKCYVSQIKIWRLSLLHSNVKKNYTDHFVLVLLMFQLISPCKNNLEKYFVRMEVLLESPLKLRQGPRVLMAFYQWQIWNFCILPITKHQPKLRNTCVCFFVPIFCITAVVKEENLKLQV